MADRLPILVPVGDELDMRGVQCAAHLGELLGVGVRVLSIARHRDVVAQRAQTLGAALDELDIGVAPHVLVHDDVAGAIAESAQAASAICMTTAATLVPHGGHFGSTAEQVVRQVDLPVILIGPKAAGQLSARRLIIPVDGSEAAEFVIPHAAGFADAVGAEVWFVTVESPAQEDKVAAVAGTDAVALESGYVMRLARRLAGDVSVTPQFEVLHGPDPADAILDFAGADGLIAMSTHGRTGLRRIFAGSVTTDVVARSALPTLVMRPPDAALEAG